MAEEALASHLELMIDSGLEFPMARAPSEVCRRPDAKGAVLALVTVAPRRRRAVRIDVTINERLLRRIDRLAEKRGQSRSGFLEAAARAVLAGDR